MNQQFSDHDVDILVTALHNHAVAGHIDSYEVYILSTKILALVGKKMPMSYEELQKIARRYKR